MVLKDPLKEALQQQIWVEKYRPRHISDVAHQKEVIATLQKAVTESAGRGDLPHLLFYGPPGTGKTSTALALCRGLFGPHNYRARVLELNASDERGIKVVRDKIKTFAQTAVSASASTTGPDGRVYPCPPFKVIVLDEADAITNDAQTALRRTMEAHSAVTRFILICNYVSKIIDPLTSRCAKFRFTPLPLPSVIGHLRRIADAERVNVTDDTLRALIAAADGDLRKAINTLQSAHRMNESGAPLSIEFITTTACLVPPQSVDAFDEATSSKNTTNKEVRAAVDALLIEGYSALQLLSQYAEYLFDPNRASGVAKMNDLQKSAISILLADTEKALHDGSDEQIQLYGVASRISAIAAKGDDLDVICSA